MSDYSPQRTLKFPIVGPLTGHWLLPEERGDMSPTLNEPEWRPVDVETIYHMTIDQRFLEVEKAFMKGSTDYVNGHRRLWAAEAQARGAARCNALNIPECAQHATSPGAGVPANPPALLPSLRLTVNRQRTDEIVDSVDAKFWPKVGFVSGDEHFPLSCAYFIFCAK